MDDFFKEENLLILKKWVYFQVKNHPDLKIEEYDSRTYKIYYQDKVARFVISANRNCRRSYLSGK